MVEIKRVITTNPHAPPSQGQTPPGGSPAPTPIQTPSSGAPGQATVDSSGQTPAQPVPATPPEEHRFTNPRLTGRSAADVEGLYNLAEQTVRQQGQQISDLTKRMQDIEAAPARKDEEKVSSQEFFADPSAAIETLLDRQIAPLRAEIADAKRLATAPVHREALRRQFADWDQVEPYVDLLLKEQNFPDPTDPGLLGTLYYTAKGLMASQGIEIVAGQPTAPAVTEPHAPQAVATGTTPPGYAPPQHRASTPPPPPRTPAGAKEARPLTELEKRLAREWKMSDEEYLYWQELDEREVPHTTYGIPEETPAGGGNQR